MTTKEMELNDFIEMDVDYQVKNFGERYENLKNRREEDELEEVIGNDHLVHEFEDKIVD